MSTIYASIDEAVTAYKNNEYVSNKIAKTLKIKTDESAKLSMINENMPGWIRQSEIAEKAEKAFISYFQNLLKQGSRVFALKKVNVKKLGNIDFFTIAEKFDMNVIPAAYGTLLKQLQEVESKRTNHNVFAVMPDCEAKEQYCFVQYSEEKQAIIKIRINGLNLEVKDARDAAGTAYKATCTAAAGEVADLVAEAAIDAAKAPEQQPAPAPAPEAPAPAPVSEVDKAAEKEALKAAKKAAKEAERAAKKAAKEAERAAKKAA